MPATDLLTYARQRLFADSGLEAHKERTIPCLGAPQPERKAEKGKLRDRIVGSPSGVPTVNDPSLIRVKLKTARRFPLIIDRQVLMFHSKA